LPTCGNVLFLLWRHLGRIGLARNPARPELLPGEIILGRPVVVAGFGGHDRLLCRNSIHKVTGGSPPWFLAAIKRHMLAKMNDA
jgi:hypothetical protein